MVAVYLRETGVTAKIVFQLAHVFGPGADCFGRLGTRSGRTHVRNSTGTGSGLRTRAPAVTLLICYAASLFMMPLACAYR